MDELKINIVDTDTIPELASEENISDQTLQVSIFDPIKKRKVVVYIFLTQDYDPESLRLGVTYNEQRYGNLDYIVEPLLKVFGNYVTEFLKGSNGG